MNRDSKFVNQIGELFEYANNFLPQINRLFSNYTGHGIVHSLNVIDYMFDIMDYPEELSDLEIVVLIYSALLHDIGMVINEIEIKAIKDDKDPISTRKYSLVYEKYGDELTALQECVRPIHGKRSYRHIMNMDAKYFILPGSTAISFQEDVAKICVAHNENFEWISANILHDQKKGIWELNSQYIAMLLRIADYLDIDEERASDYLYKYLNPKEYGDLEWRQHFIIEIRNKIHVDEKTQKKNIEFYGESTNPKVHRKLLKYIDAINNELKNAISYSETFRDRKYLISLDSIVYNKIQTKGFSFSNFKLSLDYKAVTNLLMGENIYGNKKYGLRELIQNSIDACMVMKEESIAKIEFKYDSYKPFINIILDKEHKHVIISDNGKGMSLDILKKYFLNVGVSYYLSDDYMLQGNKYCPIGNYGIGFLACFMLSDVVSVITRYYGETKTSKINFEKNSEYICLAFEETPRMQGTEIILEYDKFISVFGDSEEKIVSFIQENFVDCSIPISIKSSSNERVITYPVELKKIEYFYPQGINLSNYFNGMEVIIQFNYKNIEFLRVFSDIYGTEHLIYKEEGSVLVKEEKFASPVLLKEYIQNGIIEYLKIPIIWAEEEEFIKAYEVLEDFDDALEKIDCEYANIIAKDISLYNGLELLENDKDCIIDQYSLADFREEIGHSEEVPTYTYLEKKFIIEGKGEKLLSYIKGESFFDNRYNHTDSLYIKNVLISSAHLKIPFLAEGIELKGLVINAINKKIVPNVSRNDISETQTQNLSYAVGKAIHVWIAEKGNLEPEEKLLMEKFINECYGEKSEYLK